MTIEYYKIYDNSHPKPSQTIKEKTNQSKQKKRNKITTRCAYHKNNKNHNEYE